MLKEKITYLIDLLDADSRQLAMYSDFSESVVSRLKTGARTPDRDSRTISKLVRGAYLCGEDKGRLGALCKTIGCPENDRDMRSVCAALTDWLYDGKAVEAPSAENGLAVDSSLFGKKLSSLMEIAEISNSRLSKAVNVDPSYISRIRIGGRQIKRTNKLPKRICDILASRLIEKDKLEELSAFVELPSDFVSEEELSDLLYGWLSNRDSSENLLAVKQFIQSLESYPFKTSPAEAEVTAECLFYDSYKGTEGLRQAVTRFLTSAAERGSRELLLYSDAGLEWLGEGFLAQWTAMMTACIKNGTRMKIIHNVDRNVREMLSAITNWLPLYLSGYIEPYYCTKKQGDRFGCTLFLDPENACIKSFCVKALESDSVYNYVTDPEGLGVCMSEFEALMADSLPLLKLSHTPQQIQGSSSVFNMGKIQICIGAKSVIVNKLSVPYLSFTASHPLLCGAFRTFVDAQND